MYENCGIDYFTSFNKRGLCFYNLTCFYFIENCKRSHLHPCSYTENCLQHFRAYLCNLSLAWKILMFLCCSFYFSCSLILQRERKKMNTLQQLYLMKLWYFLSSVAFLYETEPFFIFSANTLICAFFTTDIAVFLNTMTFTMFIFWNIVCFILPTMLASNNFLSTHLHFFSSNMFYFSSQSITRTRTVLR